MSCMRECLASTGPHAPRFRRPPFPRTACAWRSTASPTSREDLMEIIDKLEATRARTLKYFDLGDDMLARTYGPGKWPVRFILHHLADTETVLYDRIRR